jgi:glycosyltransferase involved in cell wall biosynthesis
MRRLLALADGLHVHAAYMADEVGRAGGSVGDRPQRHEVGSVGDRPQRHDLSSSGRSLTEPVPPIAVIPHGHYIDAYPNTVTRADARRARHLPLTIGRSSSTVFLFFGLIRPYKGLEELLPAFHSLGDANAVLLIAGRSRPSDYAARLAAQAGPDPRVVWHPHFVPNDEVQGWMNAADIVALPYRQITTSGAAMLAWSFGKPVIAPALPAFTEPMRAAPFLGLLYDPADPAGLAEALRQATQTDWQRQREPILAWARQFDWPGIGRQMASLYQRTMNDER